MEATITPQQPPQQSKTMATATCRFNLPASASEIKRGLCVRGPADPIGVSPFPDTRSGVDSMVDRLCTYLKRQRNTLINGKRVALEIFNDATRTRPLRKLVAYARVYHHIKEIVGSPGSGYAWADLQTPSGQKLVAEAIAYSKHMGRCFFFIAANHKHDSAAVTAAQLVFDWFKTDMQGGSDQANEADELTTLVTSQGIGVADVLDALVELMGETPDGREALARVGEKHGDLLLPKGAAQKLRKQASEILRMAQEFSETLAGPELTEEQKEGIKEAMFRDEIVKPDAEMISDYDTKASAGGLF